MPYQLGTILSPEKVPVVIIQAAAEPLEARKVLVMLKQAFPELYREVWYDMSIGGSRIVGANGDGG